MSHYRRALRLIRGLGAAAIAALLQCGCTPFGEYLSPSELTDLVSNRSLLIHANPTKPDDTLLYLAVDGSGWLANHVSVGLPPRPGQMSRILDWRLVYGPSICMWATPTVGDIPSFVPIQEQCIQVLRPRNPPAGLLAIIAQGPRSSMGWIDVYPFNAFPQAATDQYEDQVRVLFGGRLPSWPSVRPLTEPQYRLQLSGGS